MNVPRALELAAARASGPHGYRRFAADALRLGPWMWPPPGDRLEATARALSGLESPPAHVPGEMLVVSTNPTRAALWVLRPGRTQRGVALANDAEHSWRLAAHAVPRALPVLASSTRELQRWPPVAAYAGMILDPCVMELQDEVLVGPSFGLAFVLSMASVLLGQPIPDEWSASAEIDGHGGLRAVGDIERKLRALGACRNRPTKVLVAQGQHGLPRTLHPRVTVVEVRSASEALDRVFPEAPTTFVGRAGESAQTRSALARNLLGLVLEGRRALSEWGAVHRAARLALETWTDVRPEVADSLTLARAVALRHDGDGTAPALPGDAWLRSVPLSRRIEIVAHLVQQCHDTGVPPFAEVEALAAPFLGVPDDDAFEPHLKVRGAWGRLVGLRGALQDALHAQEAAALGFARRFTMSEVSFPLSAWYRFAGLLRDEGAFDRAETFRADAEARGGLEGEGWAHVELARARAGLAAGFGDADAWASILEGLALAPEPSGAPPSLRADVPAHVALSAARWCLRHRGRDARDAQVVLDRAVAAPAGETTAALSVAGTLNRILADLDGAAASGDAARATACVEALTRRRPAILGHLLAWVPRDALERGRAIALHYPY